jgi:hypothetical protein
MSTIDDETGRTEPYQIIAPLSGAPRRCAPTVGRDDPCYFDLKWFATPDQGQTWVEARYQQIAAFEQRKTLQHSVHSGLPPPRLALATVSLQEAFPDHIPDKPYCADRLEDGLRIRSKSHALQHRHIQINGPHSLAWMLHDIDRQDAFCAHDDANIPPPNVIMINRENGHAHSAILLANPVARHAAARLAPLRLYSAVERGIARRLGADHWYAGLIAKNPLHPSWCVEWRRQQPYTLHELAAWLDEDDMACDRRPQLAFGIGRNVTLFDELRAFAYREVRRFKRQGTGLSAFQRRLESVALGINQQFPLALRLGEVRAIAKSVAKWTWSRFSLEKFSALQRYRAQTRTRNHLAIIQELKHGRQGSHPTPDVGSPPGCSAEHVST